MSVIGTWFLVPWFAAAASAGVTGATPPAESLASELDAYRQAEQRYASRLREVEQDTRAYLDTTEEAARGALSTRYSGDLTALDERARAERDAAMARFEGFLAKYPQLDYGDHVRFRLAELRYEEASERWLAATAAFEALGDDAVGPEPKRDLSGPLALYQEIVARNVAKRPADRYERLDGAYLMIAFIHMDANAVQYAPASAQHAFSELIAQVPNSELADRSELYLGNFAFERNDFAAATGGYQGVLEKGPEGKYYEEALYQMAWSRYKQDQFPGALELFSQLLDRSEQKELDQGKESAFAPDARRFMAFSIADIAYDTDRPAAEVAAEYFGDRTPGYRREVYEELADVLVRYTRPREAIEIYDLLQREPSWADAANNPDHQIAIIELYTDSVVRDLERAGEARLDFIERYGEGTTWWQANREDPDSLEVARTFIESSLLDVAVEYRVRAQESGNTGDYLLAADKYREYLERFPIADDYYEQVWYLADSLKLGGDYSGARDEYQALARSAAHHPYGDGAIYALMDVALQMMLAAGHAPDSAPADSDVERSYEAGGQTLDVYALSPDRVEFIEAANRVLGASFAAPREGAPEELPDYAAAVEERRPAIRYAIAQIQYSHHRFDEARATFAQLLDDHPRSIEASYAAGLLVDSYLAEGDLEQVRQYTKRFTLQPPGPPSVIDASRFAGTLEGTTFQLAMEQANQGQPLVAAQQFLSFGQEFPKSPLAKDALYNAAFYTQEAGQAERANELYEQFVREHPADSRSKGLFFRIAANYESTFDLEAAIAFYDRVLGHPEATPAERADAQYNRSFLLIGLGRNREAAEGFERYEARYSEQTDREKVLVLAGEQWEQVGQAQALAFYERYRRKYPSANPDHVIEAEYKLAELYASVGLDTTKVRRQRQAVVTAFDGFARAGAAIGPKGHDYAAQVALGELKEAYETFAKRTLTGNDDRDVKILDEAQAGLLAFEDKVKAFVAKYQSFESNSAALLLQARAALFLSDLGLSIKCPASMSEDDCWLFEDVLQENVFPKFYAVEEVGLQRLQGLVTAAREKKRYSPAIEQAMAELNRRRPADFPAVKQEIEGRTRWISSAEPPPRRMADEATMTDGATR
jgi:cellulose synthase operon protein C